MLENKVYNEHEYYSFLTDSYSEFLSHILAYVLSLLCYFQQPKKSDKPHDFI